MIALIAFGGTFAAGICCGCWIMLKVHLRGVIIQCNSAVEPISVEGAKLSGIERYWLESGIEA